MHVIKNVSLLLYISPHNHLLPICTPAYTQFQHDQVDLFCRQHTHPSSTLPLEDAELDNLFQHLLYDDTRKMVFCYVPKNGCSNMKRLMLVLNGILPPEASKENRPAETVLKEVSVRRGAMAAY